MLIIRYLLILFISVVFLNSKEISVFGAGDVASSSPYGLTKSEKVIYKNSKKINKLIDRINNIESSTEDLDQKIEGIESVYENDSKSLYKAKKTILSIKNSIKENSVNIKNNSELLKQVLVNSLKLNDLENKLNDFILLQKKNNEIVEKTLQNTIKLINNINSRYVTKKQFDELVSYINKNKIASKKAKKTKKIIKHSSKELLKYAMSLYNKNYLTKSKPYFEELIIRKYKPAQSNYYLAEIFFYKKQYKNAIHHYKISMMLYDQASYIPKLLLHSAISFENIKDKENAINFYSTLVDAYPETKEAIEANKRLKNL